MPVPDDPPFRRIAIVGLGLIGGSIDAVSDAFDTIVGTLQAILPGPLFPVAVIGVVGITAWWLFKK